MQTVLVTGGAGYIGSHICKELALNGYLPVTYDNLSRGHQWAVKWGPLEIGDILDEDRLKEVIKKHKPAIIIHFAAYAYVGESVKNPGLYYQNNVIGTFNLLKVFKSVKPDECYHLASESFVSYSFEDEYSTMNTNINGTHYLLSAVKEFAASKVKFYFAGSSEMFGKVLTIPQNENTSFNPRSSYGISKVTGYYLTKNYREAYKLHVSNGILFNHESPRRGFEFVTRKISHAVARIKKGSKEKLKLGNIHAKRDWGHAKDYVEAQWLMLQQNEPDDYVIASGESHTVREFTELAFKHIGVDLEWKGKGINEIGFDKKSGKELVLIDKQYFRPSEVEVLLGDPSKAKKELGWEAKISFEELVSEMVTYDLTKDGYGS